MLIARTHVFSHIYRLAKKFDKMAAAVASTTSAAKAPLKAHPNQSNPANPVVFFDITIGGHAQGRVVMEVRGCSNANSCFCHLSSGWFVSFSQT